MSRAGLALLALAWGGGVPGFATVRGEPAAAAGSERVRLGELLDDRPTLADPTARYSLYLPTSYDGEEKLPLLLIFDPRGRARMAAELFREAAERHGWILVSSNDSRSDSDWEPNRKALAALWPEITRFAIDPRRIYASGFSGGAIVAWFLGYQTGGLAGIIGVGGRLDATLRTDEPSFAWWGAAGSWDFNYDEMWKIDRLMERRKAPHWLEIFAGPHTWLTPELAGQAVAWMELVAMARGDAPRDAALIEEEWHRLMEGGAAMERAGEVLSAFERYRQMEKTFDGLRDTAGAAAAARRLEGGPDLQRQRRQRRRWDAVDERFAREKLPLLQLAASLEDPATADQLRRTLELPRLTTAAAGDGYEALAAKRMLHRVFTQSSFYLPRRWLAERNYRAARTALTLALEIRDDFPHLWYNLACAAARMGDGKAAMEALEEAVARGFADADQLRRDEDLESLRPRPEFHRLLARIE